MQKISFYPSTFLAEESNSMAKQIDTAIVSSGSVDPILLMAKTALATSNAKLTGVLNAIVANPYTIPLTNADSNRDGVYVGGRNVIEGFTHWAFDIAKKEAADRLLQVINRHGWSLQNFNYQKQSSATNSLIKELSSTALQADLATVGLTNWYAELIKSQEGFESVFNLKAGAKNSKESMEKREAQVPVNEDIEKLITYLNSIIMFNTSDVKWNEIFNEVEGIVKQFTTTAKTRRSAQKPDDTVKVVNKEILKEE